MPNQPQAKTPLKWISLFFKIILSLLGLIAGVALIIAVLFLIVNRTNGSLVSSGETRRYLLYAPESYDPTTPAPLVVTIHGFAEWPAHIRDTSRWNKLADQHGFIVVYPSGTQFPKHWEASNPDFPKNGQTKDVVFISDLIERLQSEYNIDPARIYVNGFSNGGGMTYLLGCQLSERIAAIGVVSGAYLFPIQNCLPTRSVPMVAFHGTADPIVPFEGGPSSSFDVPFVPVPEWIESRALLNGCAPTPESFLQDKTVSGDRYIQCENNAEVVFYRIDGQGHDWAGGKALPAWIAGTHSDAISTTDLIWEFFVQHPLSN